MPPPYGGGGIITVKHTDTQTHSFLGFLAGGCRSTGLLSKAKSSHIRPADIETESFQSYSRLCCTESYIPRADAAARGLHQVEIFLVSATENTRRQNGDQRLAEEKNSG